MHIFFTGATGFLGSYLLKHLLQDGYHCHVLVRCPNKASGKLRVLESLDQISAFNYVDPDQIHVVPGDLTQPLLGISAVDLEQVIHHCDQFIHCASSARLDIPYEMARSINLNGTEQLLDIAQRRQSRGGVKRIDIVSSAYVAGNFNGVVKEGAPLKGILFRNSYEQTKYEAEVYATNKMVELPIAIFRPSIIVGEADNGKTHNFNNIYSFLKLYTRDQWRILPANKDTQVDLVSVDYVRDAMLSIRRNPESIGGVFHLTAGEGNVLTIADIVQLAEKCCDTTEKLLYQPTSIWLKVILPLLSCCLFFIPIKKYKTIMSILKSCLPYTQQNPQFNDDKTRQLLHDTGIKPGAIRVSFTNVVNYAIASNFGQYKIKNYSMDKHRPLTLTDADLAMHKVSMGS